MEFSVLIPVYKNDLPGQLMECLDSIKKQTCPPTEVLILIDGPIGEGLKQVIDDSGYSSHYFAKNRGLPHVLNDGLKLANFNWIFRMDADDIAIPQRFEMQCNFLNDHPDVSLLGGQVREFTGSLMNLHGFRKVPISPYKIRNFGKWRNPFNHPTVAFRKDVAIRLGGYNGRAFFFEDHELWMRFIADGQKVANLPNVLVFMRIGDSFLKRRSGLSYIKHEIYFLGRLKEIGIISYPYFLLLCSVRLPLRLLPVIALKVIYKIFLRKS